jgi:hypothetical protein
MITSLIENEPALQNFRVAIYSSHNDRNQAGCGVSVAGRISGRMPLAKGNTSAKRRF